MTPSRSSTSRNLASSQPELVANRFRDDDTPETVDGSAHGSTMPGVPANLRSEVAALRQEHQPTRSARYATMRYTWKHSAYSRFTFTPCTRARFQTYSGLA